MSHPIKIQVTLLLLRKALEALNQESWTKTSFLFFFFFKLHHRKLLKFELMCIQPSQDSREWFILLGRGQTLFQFAGPQGCNNYKWAQLRVECTFPVAQTVEFACKVGDWKVWSQGQKDPLEKEMPTYFSILSWRNSMDGGVWQTTVRRVSKEPDTTERLSLRVTGNHADPRESVSHQDFLCTCYMLAARWGCEVSEVA